MQSLLVMTQSALSSHQSLCRLAGAFLLLIITASCATNPVTGDQDFVMFSEDKELQLGREYHPQIIEQYGQYDDPALQSYVADIGQRLAENSHRDDLVYRFTVLDSPVVNAFALPGGYIYITRGLMSYLNSEAELAAVLGHEIGHVTARHGVRQQSAAQAANLGYTLGAILVPGLRTAGAQDIFNILGGALLSGYGREHELESDRLGAEYLARTGYDPNAMIDVIAVLKDQSTFAQAEAEKNGQDYQGYHGLFASHPDNDTRLQQVVGEADKYADASRTRNRDAYLNRLDGMVFGDSEAQGIRSGRNFYHRDMQFALAFPENWHIENNPDSLQALAPRGEALIEMRATDRSRQQTPQQFIADRLNIDRLERGQELESHGLQGYTGIAQLQGKRARVGVMYLRDQAFIFFGAAENNARFDDFDDELLATVKSLHALRDEEQALATAQRLEVVEVDQADSYEIWARESKITNSPASQLRLLNADYPAGQLTPGQRAKRVR